MRLSKYERSVSFSDIIFYILYIVSEWSIKYFKLVIELC